MLFSLNTLFPGVPNAGNLDKMMAGFQISGSDSSARNNRLVFNFSGQFILERLNNLEVKDGRRTNVA